MLGLSPRDRVIPDRGSLAKFRVVFHQAAGWLTRPDREPSEIDAIASQFPTLGDVRIDGRFIGEALVGQSDLLESLLHAGADLAIRNRALAPAHTRAEEDQIELLVRREIRGLIETYVAYQLEKRKFVLMIREKDSGQERLIAPPEFAAARMSPVVGEILAIERRLTGCQDRLVTLWASYQAQRIALYRELGSMPYNDWETFFEQFQAARSDPEPRPKGAPGSVPVKPIPPKE